ncbi:MAG: ATP synthase subunit I [Acidobacteria bacterium]|nr:ATP synthase subunit I [Acidobacteriota bacterium]
MSNLSNSEASAPVESTPFDTFHERAIPRMLRTILVVGVLLLGPVYWYYGWVGALGVAAGSAVSYVNFRTLISGVEALGDRVVNQQSKERGWAIVGRFLVRYGLVGVAAYAILKGSVLAFRGFLWGLCLPVAAMMAEAGVEAVVAFRKK